MKERVWCQAGKHWWERPRKRGRKPIVCPEHRGVAVASDTIQVSEDKREHDQRELKSLEGKLSGIFAEYERAFNKAAKAKGYDPQLWNVADAKQSACINTQARIKALRKGVSA